MITYYESPEERQRRAQAQQASQASNASPAMRLVQGFTQPASSFMPPRQRGPMDRITPPERIGTLPPVPVASPPPRPAPPVAGDTRPPAQSAVPPPRLPPISGWVQPPSGTGFQYGLGSQQTPPRALAESPLNPGATEPGGQETGGGFPEPPPPSFNGNEGGNSDVPPFTPPPPGTLPPPEQPGMNRYGNRANLDPVYIEQQVRAAFAKKGVANPSASDVQYWINKATTPDIYSDNVVRVGWNPYWEDRLITGSASSDPRLAGNEGVIGNPSQYGLQFNITSGPGYTGPGQTTGNITGPAPTTTVGGGGGVTSAPTSFEPPRTPTGTDSRLNNQGMDQAFAALMQALGMAVPNASSLKEASKENLLAAQQSAADQVQQAAQARGLGRSGVPLGMELALADQFAGDLTKNYRDIDLASQQQGFQNLSGLANAFQGYGSERFNQQMAVAKMDQDARQFAEQMGFNYSQLSQQDKQFFQSLALNRWVAEQNARQRDLQILMGGLG